MNTPTAPLLLTPPRPAPYPYEHAAHASLLVLRDPSLPPGRACLTDSPRDPRRARETAELKMMPHRVSRQHKPPSHLLPRTPKLFRRSTHPSYPCCSNRQRCRCYRPRTTQAALSPHRSNASGAKRDTARVLRYTAYEYLIADCPNAQTVTVVELKDDACKAMAQRTVYYVKWGISAGRQLRKRPSGSKAASPPSAVGTQTRCHRGSS